jgi:uncharacterized membrane protein YgcG
MTYIKRLLFHIFMLLAGASAAWLMLTLTSKHLIVPAPLSVVLLLLFMALSLAVSMLIVPKIFPLTEEAVVLPAARKQSWAWLRPKGTGLRSGFPLNKDHVVIGREVKCAIMLNDNSVSRQHSSITRLAEGYLIRDMGSSNGTYVNGQRVQEYLLQDGDRVSIGDIEFWFEAPADDRGTTLPGQHNGGAIGGSGGGNQGSGDGFSGGGFSLDPSNSGSFGDDDDDEEGTEAWSPRPGRVD